MLEGLLPEGCSSSDSEFNEMISSFRLKLEGELKTRVEEPTSVSTSIPELEAASWIRSDAVGFL
jgi:hypothetical protein